MSDVPSHRPSLRTRGFTLVELMVAMALALLVALAAMSSLLVGSRGFDALDSGSQLRSNAQFAKTLIERIALQGGFLDVDYASKDSASQSKTVPAVMGFNNAVFSTADITALTTRQWNTSEVGSGSDVLILRYQPAKSDGSLTTSDGAMVDCSGTAQTLAATSRDDKAISVFYVSDDEGEPALFCANLNSDRTAFNNGQALVRGVENFQVLYGVQAKSPSAGTAFTSTEDSIAYTYLRADQMVVGSANSAATYANWRLVRSIRIGMVLRGEANTQAGGVSQTFYPFGVAKSASANATGSAFVSASDPGTAFTPAVDGRFRDAVTFTIRLNNSLQQ